jgi:poly(hydroxyalkanoate) depolymerase family esterase
MSHILWRLLTLALCCLLSGPASAGELRQKMFTAKSYAGSRDRHYQVFVPSTYTGQGAVPLVMVLHGCRQTEVNMINETRFKDLAERDNFIVVYPFITSYDGMREANCWGFFLDQHIHKGAGEVEDLHQIALEIEAELKIDPSRRYVTGLSSGAGMSVAPAVAHSDYFAAAGSVEGLPYAETSSAVGFVCSNPGNFKPVSADVVAMRTEQQQPEEQRPIPIMVIHSRNDCVVNKLASENIRDAWIRRYGLSPSPIATLDCTAEGVPCTQTKYGGPSAPWSRQSFTKENVAISSGAALTIGSATTADNTPIRLGRAPASCNGLFSKRIRSARPHHRPSQLARLRPPEIRSA